MQMTLCPREFATQNHHLLKMDLSEFAHTGNFAKKENLQKNAKPLFWSQLILTSIEKKINNTSCKV